MAQRSLRFGITDNAGHRAATWKLWTETAGGKADVYLACRALGGTLKASLHESGKWHIAFSPKAFERDVDGAVPGLTDRFVAKWPRPAEIVPGITRAFRIITPWSAARTDIKDGKGTKGVLWIPNAAAPEATEVDVLLVSHQEPVTEWPAKNNMGTSPVGFLKVESGETAWVVYRTVPMPDVSALKEGVGHFFKGRSRKDLESETLRMLAFSSGDDGSRVIYDLAVQGLSEQE